MPWPWGTMLAAMAFVLVYALVTGCGADNRSVPGVTCPYGGHAAAGPVPPGSRSARRLADAIAGRIAAGCQAGARPEPSTHFRDIEYFAIVSNAGAPSGFTAFAEDVRDVLADSSSAAVFHVSEVRVPAFAAASERARWRAAGSPPLPGVSRAGAFSLPRGEFSFTPQGVPLTYREATSLPTSARAMSAALAAHLAPIGGADPPATVRLKQLGFLLATAPLPGAARAAAWSALASVPGLHLCGSASDLAGRRGEAVCADAQGEEVKVLIDAARNSVLAVEQGLLKPSALYPGVPVGSIDGSDTFLPEMPS